MMVARNLPAFAIVYRSPSSCVPHKIHDSAHFAAAVAQRQDSVFSVSLISSSPGGPASSASPSVK